MGSAAWAMPDVALGSTHFAIMGAQNGQGQVEMSGTCPISDSWPISGGDRSRGRGEGFISGCPLTIKQATGMIVEGKASWTPPARSGTMREGEDKDNKGAPDCSASKLQCLCWLCSGLSNLKHGVDAWRMRSTEVCKPRLWGCTRSRPQRRGALQWSASARNRRVWLAAHSVILPY
jgi:hypothetical protein